MELFRQKRHSLRRLKPDRTWPPRDRLVEMVLTSVASGIKERISLPETYVFYNTYGRYQEGVRPQEMKIIFQPNPFF